MPPAAVAPFLDSDTQQFVDALTAGGGPPIYTLSPAAAREELAQVQAELIAKRPAVIEDTMLSVGPTGSVRIRIVRSEGAKAILPVVMHFDGAGWILGDNDTHDRMTRDIAVGADAAGHRCATGDDGYGAQCDARAAHGPAGGARDRSRTAYGARRMTSVP